MQTRRDQLRAYRFATRRIASAMVRADPEAAEQPLRRLGRSGFAGLMIAALVVAGVAILGVLRPGGGDAWRDGRSLIVDADAMSRYVFVDGVLHPVLNYTSAR